MKDIFLKIIIISLLSWLHYTNLHAEIIKVERVIASNGISYAIDAETKTARVFDNTGFTGTVANICSHVYFSESGEPECYTVTKISDNAFKGCINIRKIVIPEGIQTIGRNAFSSCRQLNDISLPSGVTIDAYAFASCTSLEQVALPDSAVLDYWVFQNCSALHSITLPQSVIQIGVGCFSGCSLMSKIICTGGVMGWNEQQKHIDTKYNEALEGCEVEFINGLTYYGEEFIHEGVSYRTVNSENARVEIIKGKQPYSGELYLKTSFNLCSIDFTLSGIAPNVFANCPDLQSIHFCGTKVRWNKLDIGKGNEILNNIPIYFDYQENTFSENNQLYWECDTWGQNSIAELKLKLRNENPICSFQFKMKLPKELTLCTDNNKEVLSFCYDRFTPSSHNISEITKQADGSYFIICTSSSNNVLEGNDGTILTMKVNVGGDVKNGEYYTDFADITVIGKNTKSERLSHLQLPVFITDVDLSKLKHSVETATKYKNKIEEYYPDEASRLEEVILLANDVINDASITKEQVADAIDSLTRVLADVKNVVPSIFISNQPKYMVIGDILDLKAVVTEEGLDECALTWSIANEEIASITTDGVITAKAKGTAKLKVKTNSEIPIFAEFEIKVWCPIITQGIAGDNITWTLHRDSTLVFTGSGSMNQYSENTSQVGSITIGGLAPWYSYRDRIKEVYIDPQIRSIGDYAFYKCTALESIELSKVQTIGSCSFHSCLKLKNIYIPNTVKSIRRFAFAYCGIDTLILPNSISLIEPSAFRYCSLLKHIEFGEGLKSIESLVFSYCGIDTLKIPNTVESIQESAFMFCNSLKHVEFGGGLKTIGKNAFQNTNALETVIHKALVPPMISDIGNSTAINYVPADSYMAYKTTSLSNVTSIPTAIELDDNEIFMETGDFYRVGVSIVPDDGSVRNLTMSSNNNNLTFVENDLIAAKESGEAEITVSTQSPFNITSSQKVNIYGGGVEIFCNYLGKNVYYSLLRNGNVKIGGNGTMTKYYGSNYSPLAYKKINSVTVTDEINQIVGHIFEGSNLSYVSLGKNVRQMDSYNFYKCPNISQIVMKCDAPPTIDSGSGIFMGIDYNRCMLYVPYGTESLYREMTGWNEFKNIIEMGQNEYIVTFLMNGSLYCKKRFLEGEPIKAIAPSTEDNAPFAGWIDLPEIMPSQDLVVHGYLIEDTSIHVEIRAEKKTVKVNEELSLTISSAPDNIPCDEVKWDVSNTNMAQITSNGVLTMCENGQVEVTAILINNNKAIATSSIQIQCSEIIEFQDQETKNVCVKAWDKNNDGELSIYEAELVTSISTAFESNRSIKYFDEFEYFTSVKTLPKWAFSNCNELLSIKLPISIQSIGDYAFYGCSYLRGIKIPANLSSIGTNAFQYCYRLYDVIIESPSIAEQAFSSSKNLATIFGTQIRNMVFCNGVKSIGDYALRSATNIESIEFPASVESIGEYLLSSTSKLKRVAINASTPPSTLSNTFKYVPFDTAELFVPYGSGEVYEATNIWNQFKHVYEIDRKIEYIGLSLTELSIAESDTSFITATIDSKYIRNKEISWKSSDESVATVDANGRVIGISQGDATITVYAVDGGAFAECVVTVTETDILNKDYTDVSSWQDVVYMAEQNNRAGDTFSIPINLKNNDVVKQVTLDLYLPDGLEVDYDEKEDEYAVELSTERTTYRRHALITELNTDTKGRPYYHIDLIPLKGNNLDGNDGLLFTISGKVAKEMTEGIHPVVLRNVEILNVEALKIKDTKYRFIVNSSIQGDVNRDNRVNVTDAIDIINDRLGYESENFDRTLSDVNQDSQYTIADAIAVINIMFGDPIGSALMARSRSYNEENIHFHYKDMNMLCLNMETSIGYTAFEFEVQLPDEVSIEDISLNDMRCSGFSVKNNIIAPNRVKVVAYNFSNIPFVSGTDDLVEIKLNGQLHEKNITISDIHFSTSAAIDVKFDDVFLNSDAAQINSTIHGFDNDSTIYYNIAGQRVVRPTNKGIHILNGKKVIMK